MGVSNVDEDGDGVDEDGSGGHFPVLAGCRNRDFYPPELGLTMTAATELFVDGGLGL